MRTSNASYTRAVSPSSTTSRDLEDVHRVVLLYGGRLVEAGPVQTVSGSPPPLPRGLMGRGPLISRGVRKDRGAASTHPGFLPTSAEDRSLLVRHRCALAVTSLPHQDRHSRTSVRPPCALLLPRSGAAPRAISADPRAGVKPRRRSALQFETSARRSRTRGLDPALVGVTLLSCRRTLLVGGRGRRRRSRAPCSSSAPPRAPSSSTARARTPTRSDEKTAPIHHRCFQNPDSALNRRHSCSAPAPLDESSPHRRNARREAAIRGGCGTERTLPRTGSALCGLKQRVLSPRLRRLPVARRCYEPPPRCIVGAGRILNLSSIWQASQGARTSSLTHLGSCATSDRIACSISGA